MKEYKFKYEAAPISEITKTKLIEAKDITKALELFHKNTDGLYEIFSIELF